MAPGRGVARENKCPCMTAGMCAACAPWEASASATVGSCMSSDAAATPQLAMANGSPHSWLLRGAVANSPVISPVSRPGQNPTQLRGSGPFESSPQGQLESFTDDRHHLYEAPIGERRAWLSQLRHRLQQGMRPSVHWGAVAALNACAEGVVDPLKRKVPEGRIQPRRDVVQPRGTPQELAPPPHCFPNHPAPTPRGRRALLRKAGGPKGIKGCNVVFEANRGEGPKKYKYEKSLKTGVSQSMGLKTGVSKSTKKVPTASRV